MEVYQWVIELQISHTLTNFETSMAMVVLKMKVTITEETLRYGYNTVK